MEKYELYTVTFENRGGAATVRASSTSSAIFEAMKHINFNLLYCRKNPVTLKDVLTVKVEPFRK